MCLFIHLLMHYLFTYIHLFIIHLFIFCYLRLFPYTALTDRFLQPRRSVFTAVRTESLTFNNSTFCPHSAFMCFVWISEQTAIISLYSINWLVFITETECVYCAVRTESLNIIHANTSLQMVNIQFFRTIQLQPCTTWKIY
jgi:hypothetical protein